MISKRTAAMLSPLVLLLTAWPAFAGGSSHTSRTYFGSPGLGPYGEPQRYHQPWTARVFGFRCCVTPEEEYQRFLQRYQIEQARHQIAMNRLNWSAYDNQRNPRSNDPNVHLGSCNCRDRVSYTNGNGGRCANGSCGHGGKCKGGSCDHGDCQGCGGKHNLIHKLFQHGNENRVANNQEFPVQRPYAGYPAMNREDAHRYIEGFQYYPPHHLLRSPRDFYMWDTKYDLGR